jgi:hypothetical protein
MEAMNAVLKPSKTGSRLAMCATKNLERSTASRGSNKLAEKIVVHENKLYF